MVPADGADAGVVEVKVTGCPEVAVAVRVAAAPRLPARRGEADRLGGLGDVKLRDTGVAAL